MAIKINVPKTITSVRSTMNTNSFNWKIVTDTDSTFNDRIRYIKTRHDKAHGL